MGYGAECCRALPVPCHTRPKYYPALYIRDLSPSHPLLCFLSTHRPLQAITAAALAHALHVVVQSLGLHGPPLHPVTSLAFTDAFMASWPLLAQLGRPGPVQQGRPDPVHGPPARIFITKAMLEVGRGRGRERRGVGLSGVVRRSACSR